MDLRLRYMQGGDVTQVVEIDKLAFPGDSWSPRSYNFEIHDSTVSYLCVIERYNPQPATGMQRIWRQLIGHNTAIIEHWDITGYAGLWCIEDEAHISTIATHPDHRGCSYGEVLFLGMCRRAIMLGAGYIVLEVRVSNKVAQNLYHKHGFEIAATKKKYYRSDGEDAYDMRIDLTNDQRRQQIEISYRALQQRLPFEDLYSQTYHPRLGK